MASTMMGRWEVFDLWMTGSPPLWSYPFAWLCRGRILWEEIRRWSDSGLDYARLGEGWLTR